MNGYIFATFIVVSLPLFGFSMAVAYDASHDPQIRECISRFAQGASIVLGLAYVTSLMWPCRRQSDELAKPE